MKPTLRRATTLAALAAVPAIAFAPLAAAVPADIAFACQGSTPLGPQTFSLSVSTEVTAPATVAPGGALSVVIDPGPTTVPGDVNGFSVKNVKDLKLVLPIPANSTYASATLSGGSGAGSTAVSVQGSNLVITASGPVTGGASFELPTVTANLTAGASGTIETKVGGTSYSDPGLTLTATVGSIIGNITVPTACYPNPNPVITTTTIG
ncbi:cyclase [Actinokineospora bangkokensis]|uniref:Cyclase n=1 Tax=Actinokineospora bangkokensis TaxID=1193682 RepID=A0A1Q9LTY5_9PSEU|nr:cyclase [Actinokineospora bangkokensis]